MAVSGQAGEALPRSAAALRHTTKRLATPETYHHYELGRI